MHQCSYCWDCRGWNGLDSLPLTSKYEGNTNRKSSVFKTKLKVNITEQKLKELKVKILECNLPFSFQPRSVMLAIFSLVLLLSIRSKPSYFQNQEMYFVKIIKIGIFVYVCMILTMGNAVAKYIRQKVTIIITLHFFWPSPMVVLGKTESAANIIARKIIVTALTDRVTIAIMYQL